MEDTNKQEWQAEAENEWSPLEVHELPLDQALQSSFSPFGINCQESQTAGGGGGGG